MARTILAPDVGWRARPVATPVRDRTLARTCACGNHAAGGACPACTAEARRKRQLSRFADRGTTAHESLLARRVDDVGGDDVGRDEGAREPDGGVPSIVHDVLRGGGQPLSQDVRGFMEPRFGADFSDVRLHTDTTAAASSTAVSAQAYTSGSHIVFGAGRYQPGTLAGQHLLAHELTHVVQQRGVSPAPAAASRAAMPDAINSPGDASEHEADATAARVLAAPAPACASASGAAEPTMASAQASPAITEPGSGIQRLSGAGFLGIVGGLVAIDLIAGALGAFDRDVYSLKELQAYLDGLAIRRRIEGKRNSDNKARDVVRRYGAGDAQFNLDAGHQTAQGNLTAIDLKRLLVLELLDGRAAADDQRAILTIVERTSAGDLLDLFDRSKGLTLNRLHWALVGDHAAALRELLAAKFPQGSAPFAQMDQRSACEPWQAVMILKARETAAQMVRGAIAALAQPAHPVTRQALDCYFTGADQAQIAQIQGVLQRVEADLAARTYLCRPPSPSGQGPLGKLQCLGDSAAAVQVDENSGGGDPEVLICPIFFNQGPLYQGSTLVHEVSHRNGALFDRAWEPKCGQLALGRALENADSYALFAQAVFERVPAAQPVRAPQPGGAGANQAPGPQAPAGRAPFPPGAPQGEGVMP